MTILGIDTSARVCSAALTFDGACVAETTLSGGLTHSETLLPSIKGVLERGSTKLKDLDLIGISVGPGSFTGLRIGINTVKGLSITHKIPCVGVSTLEALAANALLWDDRTICPVMDARRGEFYNALFRVKNGELIRLCEDRALPGEDIVKEIKKDDVLILGDGAEKFIQLCPDFRDCLAPEEIRFQSGVSVSLIARKIALSQGTVSCAELFPRYLRIPQAEREWKKKNQFHQ